MKRIKTKILLLSLALLLLLSNLASCSGKPKTLLSLDRDGTKVTFSVNFYELMLARFKGELVSSEVTAGSYTADEEKFWDYKLLVDNEIVTADDFYREQILNSCKTFTVSLWLFENMGLKLSQSETDAVNERMDELVKSQGEGSKTKLNSLLSEFGVNYDLLRDAYLMEAKVRAVKTALYGENAELVGKDIKDDYLNKRYVRFKQIFLPTFAYVYQKDAFGDEIYFDAQGAVAYDTKGVKHFTDRVPDTDKNGDDIYYTDTTYTKIAYDTVNGHRSPELDLDGTAKTVPLNPETVKSSADSLLQKLNGASPTDFETEMQKAQASVPDGVDYAEECYLSVDTDYGEYSYLSDIVTDLSALDVGGISMVQSDAGFHVFMKYAPVSGAYDEESNETWFKNFRTDLIESLYLDYCSPYYADIVLSEDVYQKSNSMKEISADFYY